MDQENTQEQIEKVEPKTRTSITISPDTLDRARRFAARQISPTGRKMSVSELIETSLVQYLDSAEDDTLS